MELQSNTLAAFAGTLGSRPLFVMPHPDDESYALGGLLWTLGALGAQPRLVCCAVRAADQRYMELQHAWQALGLDPRLIDAGGMPDGDLEAKAVGDAVKARLGDATALAVLGPEGVYGHKDHLVVWHGATTAWRSNPRIPLVWPVFPDGASLFAPLRTFLSRTAPHLLGAMAARVPPHETLQFSLEPAARAAKRAAMAAHKSQLPKGQLGLFLGRGVTAVLSDNETYAIAMVPA